MISIAKEDEIWVIISFIAIMKSGYMMKLRIDGVSVLEIVREELLAIKLFQALQVLKDQQDQQVLQRE